MVLVMSILLFVLVTCTLYLFGVKVLANPKSMVARAMGEGPQNTEPRLHASLAFHELLTKIGNLVPASPADLSAIQKKLYRAGFRSGGAFNIFYGIKALSIVGFPCSRGC